ncbi:MAG TPA: MerR family transcriptional regulator [Acidimicrobiales bacterium]|nr:MerR family transcriptional regulator [Acidimicrobiales bacterium]
MTPADVTVLYRIGEVAERVGVSPRTLRYYEELGLLAPSDHSAGGARRYSEEDVARLLRIRELQELLGFDLGEIKVVLGAEDRRAGLRSEYLGSADLARRREILAEAVQINERLRSLVRAKQARLDEMMRTLDDNTDRYRSRAEELEAEDTAPDQGEGRARDRGRGHAGS